MFGLATTGTGFWLAIPIWNLWGLAGPTAQGLMSHRVSPSEQGQLQGAINGLRGVAGLIGPALFAYVFAASIRPSVGWHLPGAPFYLAALLLFTSLLLALRVTRAA